MAHKIKVLSKPHVNKDGSESKTKKDWFFRDRNRSGVFVSELYGTQKEAQRESEIYRDRLADEHVKRHPNDTNFLNKRKGI